MRPWQTLLPPWRLGGSILSLCALCAFLLLISFLSVFIRVHPWFFLICGYPVGPDRRCGIQIKTGFYITARSS